MPQSTDLTRPFTRPCPPEGHPTKRPSRTLELPPPTGHLQAWLDDCGFDPTAGIQARLRVLQDAIFRRQQALQDEHRLESEDRVIGLLKSMHRRLVLRLETPADRMRRESICPTCGVSPRPDRPAPPAASRPRRQASPVQPEPKPKPASRPPKQTDQLIQHLADIGAALTRNRRS